MKKLPDIVIPALALLILASAIIWLKPPVRPQLIPAEDVWRVVQREAARHHLDPHFVFAIVFVESSLNAHADSGVARGIMQIKPDTWAQMTDRSYQQVWNWQLNIRVGTDYLGWLAESLRANDRFSYALLAASFHHGPGAVRRAGYDLARLPPTRNRVYQQIYAGIIPAALAGQEGPPRLPVQEPVARIP